MANKVTIKDMFNEVIALAEANGREDIVEFAKGRIEVLDRKAENKKASAKQEANEVLKENILKALAEVGKAVNITDLKVALKAFDENEYSTPKISALLKQLKDAEKVIKTMDGKTPFYAVA